MRKSEVNKHVYKPFLAINKQSAEFNKSPGPAGHQVRFLKGPTEIRTLPVQTSDTLFCTVYLALMEVSVFPCQKHVNSAHWIIYIFVGESDCLKLLPLVNVLRNKSRLLIGYKIFIGPSEYLEQVCVAWCPRPSEVQISKSNHSSETS